MRDSIGAEQMRKLLTKLLDLHYQETRSEDRNFTSDLEHALEKLGVRENELFIDATLSQLERGSTIGSKVDALHMLSLVGRSQGDRVFPKIKPFADDPQARIKDEAPAGAGQPRNAGILQVP